MFIIPMHLYNLSFPIKEVSLQFSRADAQKVDFTTGELFRRVYGSKSQPSLRLNKSKDLIHTTHLILPIHKIHWKPIKLSLYRFQNSIHSFSIAPHRAEDIAEFASSDRKLFQLNSIYYMRIFC